MAAKKKRTKFVLQEMGDTTMDYYFQGDAGLLCVMIRALMEERKDLAMAMITGVCDYAKDHKLSLDSFTPLIV